MLTPYEILGVARSADDEAIRAAFRRAAKAYHPDVNGDDPATEQHLKQAIDAYQTLMDPRRRASWDRRLRQHHRRRGARRFLVTALVSGGAASAAILMLTMWVSGPKGALPPVSHPAPPQTGAGERTVTSLPAAVRPQALEVVGGDAPSVQPATSRADRDSGLDDGGAVPRVDPADARALRDRGALWRRRGALDRALADLDQAIRLGFSDAGAYNERGLVWSAKGQLERAIADFNQAIKLDPGFAAAYVNRADALRSKGDMAGATADLEHAARIGRNQ